MSYETREPSTLEYGLRVAGVVPGWHHNADADIWDAYEQVQALKEQTGLDVHIDNLRVVTPSTYIHVSRLGRAATEWSVQNGLSHQEVVEIAASVEAHDIGKVAMPELIEYEGIFNERQRQLVREHPVIGASLFLRSSQGMEDRFLRKQISTQILCHHMHHGDGLVELLTDRLESRTAVRAKELHTYVRIADMIDASGNLAARPYAQKRYSLGGMKRLVPDNDGRLIFNLGHLVDELTDTVDIDPRHQVLGRALGQLIEELAAVLPPTMPRNTKFDAIQGIFVVSKS